MMDEPSADLSHAGAIVDKAIEHMMGQGLDPMAAASALLGGSLGLMACSMDDAVIERVLNKVLRSLRSGELRAEWGPRA